MFTYSIYLLITRYNELSFTRAIIWAAQHKWCTHLFTNVCIFGVFFDTDILDTQLCNYLFIYLLYKTKYWEVKLRYLFNVC